jgi:hypothetical protein
MARLVQRVQRQLSLAQRVRRVQKAACVTHLAQQQLMLTQEMEYSDTTMQLLGLQLKYS